MVLATLRTLHEEGRASQMKILLVGGLGFIGKHLIRRIGEPHSLTVLSDAEAAWKNASFVKTHGINLEIGDITDEDRVRNVMLTHSPELVVHLAALTGIKRCNENPSLAFSVNVFGTYNIVMGCVKCKSKLIFISSREVYGESVSDRTQECDPLVPNNVYGVTKLLGEKLVTWAGSRYNLDYTILRLTNVYGPDGDQYNVQAMIKKALTEGKIQILGGNQRMNFIYVEDVAEVVGRCFFDPRSSRQIFNVGAYDSISVEEVVSKLVSLLDVPPRIERLPMRDGETLNFRPSIEKLEKELDYRPTTTFTMGLRKTVEWYRDKMRPAADNLSSKE